MPSTLHSLEWAARAVGLDSRFVNSRSSYSSYGLVLSLVRWFWGAFASFKIVFITFIHHFIELSGDLSGEFRHSLATQNLSELMLTWEWILRYCNDFYAERTQTGQLSWLNYGVAFLQSAARNENLVSESVLHLPRRWRAVSSSSWQRGQVGSDLS